MAQRRLAIYVILILALVGGFLSGRAFFYNITCVFGGILIASLVFSWASINWLNIGRHTLVRRAQVGQYFEENFAVRNKSIIPKLWLEIRDHSDLPGHNSSQVVPFMTPSSTYRWKVGTLCVRRGQFTLGPMTVTSGDPFGFYIFPRHIGATSSIIVYPITVPIYDFATPTGALSGGQAIRRRTFEITPNAAGIREYAPGDSLNRIHWKSTARRGKLLVKEFEEDPLGDVWIILDLSKASLVERPSVATWGASDLAYSRGIPLPPSTEEYAIAAAGSIAQFFVEKGRSVGFLSYTPHRDYVAPDRGDRQLTDILEVLAVAKSETQLTLLQLLSMEAQHLTRGTTLVLITASLDTSWAALAHVQVRRGLSVIAVMIDPTSFGVYGPNFEGARQQVEAAGVTVYPLRQEDDLTATLSYRPGTNGKSYANTKFHS
ncbi:MAG: hypothetical protein BroJett018_14170 [Chloroflexota bacterium]|nr:DUF58 domain-containing protein [Chloroflexota bacterium]NOG62966.1 DUF58 domain-containing protein [Chloroflexota bacterium]GIK63623.1 MAG: hypothetical protein BroJett018_14170 [Chloroflexota bacterium]